MNAATQSVIEQVGTRSVSSIRADFPILHQQVNGHPLVYLDNAASSQHPQVVIDAISQ